jgi:hypothetical protein
MSLLLVSVTRELLAFGAVMLSSFFFHISCVSTLRFAHLRPSCWVNHLISVF